MEHVISIYERGIFARTMLEDMLQSDDHSVKQLRPLIENLDRFEENEDTSRNWWIAYNKEKEAVIGLISVRYEYDSSILEAAWTSTTSNLELQYTINALISTWENSSQDTKYLVVNLEKNSKISEEFGDLGFNVEKPIVVKYKAPTRFYIFDDDSSFIVRKPKLHELESIYDELIAPDMDRDSLIYISKENFLQFSRQFESFQKNSLLITSETGILLGFAASFLDPTGKRPTLFGPHSIGSDVEDRILSEFLTYWRLMGKTELTILRTKYISKSLADKYRIEISQNESILKYVKTLRLN